MTAKGDFFPFRTNDHVPNMQYACDVRYDGTGEIDIPAPDAADADVIIDGQSIATAGSTTTFNTLYVDTDAQMGKFGRNLTVVADGTATSTVTVTGKDYLGQVVVEEFTLNGTTPVVGKKAFRTVTSVAYDATASRSIDVGTGALLGLPYKTFKMDNELVDGAVPTAGSVTAGVTVTQTATSGDPRGTYAPHASAAPNGSRAYKLQIYCDRENLHGNAHFAG